MPSPGDIVRVLAPFAENCPDEYLVVGENNGVCTLLIGDVETDFDEKFLTATKKTAPLPAPEVDKVDPEITRETIKNAMWNSGDPVEAIAVLFGVKS